VSRRPARRRLLAALCATCALALLPGATLASAPPSLGVSGAILIEQSTGKVLYAVNPDRRLAIARRDEADDGADHARARAEAGQGVRGAGLPPGGGGLADSASRRAST